jgi:hypothetical protein
MADALPAALCKRALCMVYHYTVQEQVLSARLSTQLRAVLRAQQYNKKHSMLTHVVYS